MKNKDIAIMLSLLPTGWFGAHKYYVGKKRTAALYTIFIWTMIPIIKSVFDGIILLRIDNEKFVRKYSTKEEYDEYIKTELQKQGIISPDEEDAEDKNEMDIEIQEPDYSDYYGPWGNN